MEQQEPLFLALLTEQLSDFSVEHSFEAFASTAHLSDDTFLTAAVFTEQQDPEDLAAALVPQDSPPPAMRMAVETKKALTARVIARIFIVDSVGIVNAWNFGHSEPQNRFSGATYARKNRASHCTRRM